MPKSKVRSQKQRRVESDYPPDWKDIARGVKEAANWTCVRCDHPHDPQAGYTLTVHHLAMDPANCELWNLAALCQRCHLKIQNRMDFHQQYMLEHSAWMKPFVEGFKKAKGLA